MADSRADPRIFLLDPDERGVLPLDRFHIPKRLRRTVKSDLYAVTCDQDFPGVVEACADPAPGREDTWINDRIVRLYTELHQRGHAHSLEVRDAEGALVGGLYGVVLGAAYFGESMFSRARDASKVALVHLVARLIAGNYRLLDAQFITEHLRQFGAEEIPRAAYHRRLRAACAALAHFDAAADPLSGADALALVDAAQRGQGETAD